ncbi:BrnT family toxin [Duganella sp. CF517]|uniref:BrnT family toxin n=1 Tax=Duganella sp. CF517 TaxID=1881038 RepID=UPI000B7C9860
MITWDENKRKKNLRKHGIDFADLEAVFDYPILSDEDSDAGQDEMRIKSLCLFRGDVVVIIWTPRPDNARIISCRYGDKHETQEYFGNLFHPGTN